jgi:hypothetical protein
MNNLDSKFEGIWTDWMRTQACQIFNMLKRRNFWESPLASPLSIKGQRKVPELDTINRPGSMKENYQQTQQQISAPPVLAVVLIWISYFINFRLLTGWDRRASPSRHFARLNIKSAKRKKRMSVMQSTNNRNIILWASFKWKLQKPTCILGRFSYTHLQIFLFQSTTYKFYIVFIYPLVTLTG